jgi:hypothetical protein
MLNKIKKLFNKFNKKKETEMIASYPCSCKGNCNKGLFILKFNDDDDLLEIGIDWRISKTPPELTDKSVSVLVSRKFILENLIKSGKPLLEPVKFQDSLDKYYAEFASQGKLNEYKLPTEVKMQEFMDWLKIKKIEKDYEEFKE